LHQATTSHLCLYPCLRKKVWQTAKWMNASGTCMTILQLRLNHR
jgi:hypothetical protein